MNEILKLLESYVGPPIIDEDGKKNYIKLERKEEQEKDFKVKLSNLLRTNKKVFKEITNFPNNEKVRKRVVDEFIFNFGPKTLTNNT